MDNRKGRYPIKRYDWAAIKPRPLYYTLIRRDKCHWSDEVFFFDLPYHSQLKYRNVYKRFCRHWDWVEKMEKDVAKIKAIMITVDWMKIQN